MKITIGLPENFHTERKYALEILLGCFKDVELIFTESENNIYQEIQFENDSRILLKNHLHTSRDSALYSEPQTNEYPCQIPRESSIRFAGITIDNRNYDFVCLYGTPDTKIFHNQKIVLETDYVAGTFFMLTGFEEYKQPQLKDEHGRFPDEESLAVKVGFYNRPIVNEYIEVLRALITKLTGVKITYNREYRPFITHDVDEIYRLKPLSKAIKRLGGDLLVRRNLKEFFITLKQTALLHLNFKKDPADVFDYFMDTSDKHGVKSNFYFICGKPGEEDFQYDIDSPPVSNIIKNIQSRNHNIGFHASYGTPGNFNQFTTELRRLQRVCGSDQKITEGRQHFLRLQIPEVWQHWNKAGLQTDSSMGYHNYWGFRRGICFEYPVFDLETGQILPLTERPLIVMEVALKRQHPDPEFFKKQFIEAVNTVKKYKGDFVFLWHNSNINHPYWRKYALLYEELVEITAN